MHTRTTVIGSRILLLVPVLLLLQPGGRAIAQREPSRTIASVDPSGLSGSWRVRNHENGLGDDQLPGDYIGIPLNDEGRSRGDAWSSTYQEMLERQCIPYNTHFLVDGNPSNVQMWAEADSVTGRVIDWKMSWFFGTRTIWMDGRPHPPAVARHTALGFSTGRMIGDVLHVRTTHLAEGMIWQSGVPSSNQATISEYISRQGDMLSLTMILYDPIYLDEPLIRTKTHVLDPTLRVVFRPCDPAVEIQRVAGSVPHWLPGANPHVGETTKEFGIPLEAVRGGAATLYPEFRKKLKDTYKRPAAMPEWLILTRRERGFDPK